MVAGRPELLADSRFALGEFGLLFLRLRRWSPRATARAGWLALLAALADVGGLAALVPLVALVLGNRGGQVTARFEALVSGLGASTPAARIAAALVVFLAAMALRAALAGARDAAILRLQSGYTAHLQKEVMARLAAAPWSRVEGLRHARITHALGPDAVRAASAAQLLLQIAGGALVLVLQWLLALAIAPAMALAVAIVAALAAGVFARSLLRTGSIGASLNARGLSLIHIAQQFLGGLKLAKAQNAEAGFVAGFEGVSAHILDLRVGYQLRQIRNRQAIAFAVAAAAALFLLVGRWAGLDGARLIASFAVLTRISAAGTNLVQQLQLLSSVLPSHTSLVALVDELGAGAPREAAPPAAALPAPAAADALIAVESVGYAPAGTARLAGVSLALAPGEIVALTGESGAGKTTLIDVMTGLLTPTEGTVTVHGRPLDPAAARTWRDRLAYVTQETWLSNDTIRANLLMGRMGSDAPLPGDDALWHMLALVGAEDLVRSSEHGLDTMLNEQGSRFSGGERQRLALARALLRSPELLILDEATNAIDPASEAGIFARILAAMPAMSWLVIAHRPSTLAFCRRRLRLESGRLVEDRAL